MRSFFILPWCALAVFCFVACGDEGASSICGSTRPCLPQGTWEVSYAASSTGFTLGPNTIRVDEDGAEVVGEEPPVAQCRPDEPPTEGRLRTHASLSNDGCTLLAEISKDWCEGSEPNCDHRLIELDFCENGSATVAVGELDACVCWVTTGPFCSVDSDYETLSASARRIDL